MGDDVVAPWGLGEMAHGFKVTRRTPSWRQERSSLWGTEQRKQPPPTGQPYELVHWFPGLANTVYVYQCNGGYVPHDVGGVEDGGGETVRRPAYFFLKTVANLRPIKRPFMASARRTGVQSARSQWKVDFYAHVLVRPASKLFVRHTALLMLPSAPCCDEGVEGNSIFVPRIGRSRRR